MMKNYAFFFFFLIFAGMGSIVAQQSPVVVAEEENTEIDNFVLNEAVTMYPNPVQSILTINSNFPITRVQIYSLVGDLVFDERGNVERLNIRSLNSGIYMIKIHSNRFSITKKLIKK